jgi:hypothetical protein
VTTTIDPCHPVVEPGRPGKRAAHSEDFFCAADFCGESAAQLSLEIERKIGLKLAGLP